MTDPVVLDTNIVIDYLRGRTEAVAFVSGLASAPLLSSLTVAELYQGVRDTERVQLANAIAGVKVVAVDESLAVAGGLLARMFRKSHGVGLADAIIAATGQHAGLTLVTLNRKHFPMITDLVVPYT